MKTGARKAITIFCICAGLLFTAAVPALAANNYLQPGTAASSFDETTVTTTVSGTETTLTSTETAVETTTATQVTTVFVEQPAAPSTAIPIYLIAAIIVIFVVLIALLILLLFSRKRKTG